MRALIVDSPVPPLPATPGTPPEVELRVSEYPRASRLLVHFSDTHLLAGDARLWGTLDSANRLAAALVELEASGARPDALIFTGDLADLGQAGAYLKIRTMVEPVAERLGAKLIWLMGNHDHREEFRVNMLDHLPTADPIDMVYDFDGLRVIALDTSVPGSHHGALTDAQLSWLSDVLATPAEHGTILAMHHPPIPAVIDMAMTVELHDQRALAAVIRGTDVRTILAGHLHYSSSSMFAGVPVSVASATCYTQDLSVPVGGARPRDSAQAFNLVHVYEETIVHSVVPVGTGPVMCFVSPEEAAANLAAAGIAIRER